MNVIEIFCVQMDVYGTKFVHLSGKLRVRDVGHAVTCKWITAGDTKTCSNWVLNMPWLIIKHLKLSTPWHKLSRWKFSIRTVRTTSEKLTLTCVNMHMTFASGFTSSITIKYWQEARLKRVFQYTCIIISKEHWRKLALWSAKLQIFADYSCHLWQPI